MNQPWIGRIQEKIERMRSPTMRGWEKKSKLSDSDGERLREAKKKTSVKRDRRMSESDLSSMGPPSPKGGRMGTETMNMDEDRGERGPSSGRSAKRGYAAT